MIYAFEHYSLNTDRREFRRGADAIALEPQVFDILVYLIGVSNDELIGAVWNGRIVSESTLSSRISAVRQAVGDSGERQSLIRTFSRKGYRFLGEVREEHGSGDGDRAKPEHPAERPATTPAAPAIPRSGSSPYAKCDASRY